MTRRRGYSDADVEVVRLIAEGLTNRQIGIRTNRSVWTIKARLTRLFSATGARNRAHLVSIFREKGLMNGRQSSRSA